MGYNDELKWHYSTFHYSPVADAFAVGGHAYDSSGERYALILTYYGKTPHSD